MNVLGLQTSNITKDLFWTLRTKLKPLGKFEKETGQTTHHPIIETVPSP